jgi:uncharacterized protein (TIGR02118 family)
VGDGSVRERRRQPRLYHKGEEIMVRVSVFYPNVNRRFDMQYYVHRHIPMVKGMFGSACKSVSVEGGLGGLAAGSPASYVAMAHFSFESLEDFQAVFAPNVGAIAGDMINYTDIEPTMQMSRIEI